MNHAGAQVKKYRRISYHDDHCQQYGERDISSSDINRIGLSPQTRASECCSPPRKISFPTFNHCQENQSLTKGSSTSISRLLFLRKSLKDVTHELSTIIPFSLPGLSPQDNQSDGSCNNVVNVLIPVLHHLKTILQQNKEGVGSISCCSSSDITMNIRSYLKQVHGILLLFIDFLLRINNETKCRATVPLKIITDCLLDLYQTLRTPMKIHSLSLTSYPENSNESNCGGSIRIALEVSERNEAFGRVVHFFLRIHQHSTTSYSPSPTSNVSNDNSEKADMSTTSMSSCSARKSSSSLRSHHSIKMLSGAFLRLLHVIIPCTTATNISMETQRAFVVALVEKAGKKISSVQHVLNNNDNNHSSSSSKNPSKQNDLKASTSVSSYVAVLASLASHTKLVILSSFAGVALTTMLTDTYFMNYYKFFCSDLQSLAKFRKTPSHSQFAEDQIDTYTNILYLFQLQCSLILKNIKSSSNPSGSMPGNDLALLPGGVPVGNENGYVESEHYFQTQYLLRIIVDNPSSSSDNNDDIRREEKKIALDCFILLSQCTQFKKQQISGSNPLLKACSLVMLTVDDDYAIKSKAVEGLYNCIYKSHNYFRQLCQQTGQDPQSTKIHKHCNLCGDTVTKSIVHNFIIDTLNNNPVKIKKLVSSILEVIMFGQDRICQIDDFQQFRNPMVAATMMLLDIMKFLMMEQKTNDRIFPPEDLISICMVVFDIGHRRQHHPVSRSMVQLVIRWICDMLPFIQSAYTMNWLSSKSVNAILTSLVKVLNKNKVVSCNMQINVLDAIHQVLKNEHLHNTHDDFGVRWTFLCASNRHLVDAVACEAALIVQDPDASEELRRIVQKRRSLAVAIISLLTKNVCSRRILAKHPNVLSSMVRFVRQYDGTDDIESMNTNDAGPHNLPSIVSTGMDDVCRNELKEQIFCLAKLL